MTAEIWLLINSTNFQRVSHQTSSERGARQHGEGLRASVSEDREGAGESDNSETVECRSVLSEPAPGHGCLLAACTDLPLCQVSESRPRQIP